MHLQYKIAFSVYFQHPYFDGGKLRSLTVQPSVLTTLDMRKNGYALKYFGHGFHVLFDSLFAGNIRTREEALEGGVLRFLLMNNDSSFFNYTPDFGADITKQAFYFSNSLTGLSQQSDLHNDSVVDGRCIRPADSFGESFFIKPFGVIDITLGRHMENTFFISYAGLSTYWRYLLVHDYLQELINPAIVHKDARIGFTGPEAVLLPDGKKALCFCSPDPIALCESPDKSYQLIEYHNIHENRYRVILPSLPNPDIHTISFTHKGLEGIAKARYSEIYL